MKKLLVYLCFLSAHVGFGQVDFVITEEGITPPSSTIEIGLLSASELYAKTLHWVQENEKSKNLSIEKKEQNTSIQISSLKGNAVKLDKQYYNAKYTIGLRFESGKYIFKPMGIQLKLNSKYDMGWKEFDLSNTSVYFKKGKPTRKYKAYLDEITKELNELSTKLRIHLESE